MTTAGNRGSELVVMSKYRSIHMPASTSTETTNSTFSLRRNRGIQNNCGAMNTQPRVIHVITAYCLQPIRMLRYTYLS